MSVASRRSWWIDVSLFSRNLFAPPAVGCRFSGYRPQAEPFRSRLGIKAGLQGRSNRAPLLADGLNRVLGLKGSK